MPDPAVIIPGITLGEVGVQLGERVNLGHRDGGSAALPATLTLDTTLLMGLLHAGTAVEHVEAVVGPEQSPTGPDSTRVRPVNTRDTAAFRLS